MHKNDNTANRMIAVLIDAAEIMLNGVMVLNEEGHILGINGQFAQELGYSSKEAFHPKTIFEVNPNTSLLSWKKLWKKLLDKNHIRLETEQIRFDDAVFPVRMRGVLLQFGNTPVCLCIIENLMQSNRFKDLLNLTSEIAGIGSWEWDLVKDEILATQEVYRILNLSPKNTLNPASFEQLIAEKLNEKERHLFLQNIEHAIKKAKAFDMELSIKNDAGFENYHLHARPIWHENQTIKVYGTLQNLAKVSRRTDDLYFTKFCMDNARDMIFWVKKDGTLRYVNQTACLKLGYLADELLQKNIELIDKKLSFDFNKQWKQLKKEGSLEFETNYFSKEGKEIPVSVIANYINYLGTKFNCCFVRDLSAQKKRNELITMAKHTLDNSQDMIFWLNFDGSFKYFNDTFLEKTGYNRSEIQKMKVFNFFQDSDAEQFQEGWKQLKNGTELGVIDRELQTKNGDIISCEMTVSMVKFGDNEFSSNVLRNVNERKKKERQIALQYEEIERLQKETQAENVRLKEEIDLEFNFSNIISRDPNYKKVLRQVEQVADTDATVLILGETGTGKELLARAIHKLSTRYEKPLIKINCGSLPENLIESELFGHEKGSFTGAYKQKIGKFERAHTGTVFLDEIGELPLDLQTKLLRVLQEGEIERVGGTELIKIDVRIIAATNRNLEQQVIEGKFREDLFYRLNVFPIRNIPLRERREDIPILIKYFAEKYSKRINKPIKEISQVGLNKLMTYNFLGNVRELENLVERAVILTNSNVLTFDFPTFFKKAESIFQV